MTAVHYSELFIENPSINLFANVNASRPNIDADIKVSVHACAFQGVLADLHTVASTKEKRSVGEIRELVTRSNRINPSASSRTSQNVGIIFIIRV
jgi:hypothetical protein